MDYKRKIDFAVRLLRAIPQDGPIEVSYSGGKDSDVILELAKMSGIPFEAIYKDTTIDPPGTHQHCKENGVTIMRPKRTMLQIIEAKGWPTRRARFCCGELKEYKVHDRAIQGIRRAESSARAKRYKEPEICRLYPHKEKVRVYLPILEWTNEDVQRFVEERKIKLHPLYYDENGDFHPERRLGCIGCPMKSDCGKSDFIRYPKMLKAWISAGKKFLQSNPASSSRKKFGDAYHLAYHNLFTDSYSRYEQIFGGGQLFDNQYDVKSFLENYFKVDLSDIDKL